MIVAAGQPLRALASAPVLSQVSISIPSITPATVMVSFTSLPGNTPKTNQNFVAIWESTIIPWPIKPLAVQQVPLDQEQGSVVMSGLSVQSKPYIIGYGVGPLITDICASAIVYVGGQPGGGFSSSIGIESLTADAIVVHYVLCSAYQPLASGNWIGIWQGSASPFFSGPPLVKALITGNSNEGYVAMNGLNLAFGTQYTLVYFVGPALTNAAAILNFSTAV